MAVAAYPKKDTRKVYEAPLTTWDLNSGGLYSFKIVKANEETGEVNLTENHPDFTEFVLPVNPQGLQVSIPFSISVIATAGGVLEEANGVVFRNISINGTFGVAARRATVSGAIGDGYITSSDLRGEAPQNQRPSVGNANINSAIVNTLGGVETLLQTVKNAGTPPQLYNAIRTEDLEELGHRKINDLLNYFVAYAELKKTLLGKHVRLLFINRKDGVNYACTPLTFDTTKDANDPHLTRYRIQLKAWDLATTNATAHTVMGFEGSPKASELTKAMNALRAARSVVSAAQGMLRGIVSDFDGMVSAINTVAILLKETNGIHESFLDLDGPTGLVAQKGNELVGALEALGAEIPQVIVADVTNLNRHVIKSGTNASNFENQQIRDYANPLRTPEQRLALADFLDQIPISAIPLTPAERDIATTAIGRAQNLTISDLDTMRAQFEEARNALNDSLGLTDATVNAITGRKAGPKLRDPQSTDYQVLQSFSDLVGVVDTLTAARDLTGVRTIDPFARAQDNANNPEIRIVASTTGLPIPFPFGGNLEGLAKQYLGSPDRWIEIAVANGLKAPYVDEKGFEIFLSASGSGNTFLVKDASKLFAGQEVFVSSRVLPQTRRRVTEIRKLASDSYLIQVDGSPDLANYKVNDQAKVKGFAPYTVNSSKTIIIPTPGAIADSVPNTRQIPSTVHLNRQQKAMGVDLLLTSDFDLAIAQNGDFKLSTGLTNAVQAIKLGLSIEKGSLLRHPEKGLGVQVGTRQRSSNSIRSAIENAVLSDGRFESIRNMTIIFDGSVVRLNLAVKVAGGSDVIPLAFALE